MRRERKQSLGKRWRRRCQTSFRTAICRRGDMSPWARSREASCMMWPRWLDSRPFPSVKMKRADTSCCLKSLHPRMRNWRLIGKVRSGTRGKLRRDDGESMLKLGNCLPHLLQERAALEMEEASRSQKRPASPNSNYRDKYSHLIGTSAAKDAAHTLQANQSYGCVPVANKRDTRSIEEAMNEIRAKKRQKKGAGSGSSV
ncbi:uncharacterized protein LOC107752241 isoform X4 [Sinocyclocheilus rhinocerous]|uniref:uncharacterized protein LOC107752241 isoform X4 n=1 Tax=Sinocyclocheilus rhinocerous TaxID=307959 RepID=UPI0007B92AAB|nr:PREDICTED: sperm-associated antigen 7 isoform X4 [Sinocyclocheilus rhinocerous]